MWRVSLIFEILVQLVKARRIRWAKAKNGVLLPAVSTPANLDEQQITRIVNLFDGVLSILMFRNKHICFYRAYALSAILRKRGLSVVMNVGGRGFRGMAVEKAHCWLSLNEDLFFEKENALDLYPMDMGSNPDGSIRYWVGPELNQSVLSDNRLKRSKTIQPFYKRIT